GYLTYRANRLAGLARKFPSAAIRLGLAAARVWPVSDDKISLEYMAKRFLEGCLLPPERAHVYWNGTFSRPPKGPWSTRHFRARLIASSASCVQSWRSETMCPLISGSTRNIISRTTSL